MTFLIWQLCFTFVFTAFSEIARLMKAMGEPGYKLKHYYTAVTWLRSYEQEVTNPMQVRFQLLYLPISSYIYILGTSVNCVCFSIFPFINFSIHLRNTFTNTFVLVSPFFPFILFTPFDLLHHKIQYAVFQKQNESQRYWCRYCY